MSKKEKKEKEALTLKLVVVSKDLLNTLFKKEGKFGFAPKCHSICATHILVKGERLELTCNACKTFMNEVQIAAKGRSIELRRCESHPEITGYRFWYDGEYIMLSCPECNATLHRLTPN